MSSPTYKNLMNLISMDVDNEERVCSFMEECLSQTTHQKFAGMINQPLQQYSGGETMLMWAVWRLKKSVVKKLLECGAYVEYENEMGNSVSTYWDTEAIKKNEDAACDIAKMLHEAGADLLRSYSYSWCIVQKAREYGFAKLQATIESLDEAYASYEFDDEVPNGEYV